MITYEKKDVEKLVPKTITCDVCKKVFSYEFNSEGYEEVQEFHHISFIGGYGSIFGDMVGVSADICQHCLKEKLGGYLLIDEQPVIRQ